MATQVDVIVIGLGVGGESVASQLAEAGLDVLGVEGRLVGGECPYWGCVPSKMMIRGADLVTEAHRMDGTAGYSVVLSDWRQVAGRVRREATSNWNDQVAVDRLTGTGCRFARGWARIIGPGEVEVDGARYTAQQGVVLGCGTVPSIPPVDGLAETPYWTNREAIEADPLPTSLVVLGGGAVGLELAQVYARFGVEVTVVEAAPRLLPMEEPESSQLAERVLGADSIGIHTGVTAQKVAYDGTTFAVHGAGGVELRAAQLLVSAGRKAQLAPLGVDTIGLDPAASSVPVDERMRAGDEVWAVGDVTGRGAFTHVATYQADIVVRDILGEEGPPADYRALPRVTFTDPEIAAVGQTEEQAREAGLSVGTGYASLPTTTRGWIHKVGNDGLIKLVADTDRGILVGATTAGPSGGEMLGALAVAVHAEVPIEQLDRMIYAYPTFHRGIVDALRDLST